MEQDPPPLSEIKTGYTPTTSASATDIAHDYSRYENLDTPTPIRSSDIMAYTTRFDLNIPTSSQSGLNPVVATDTQMGSQRPMRFDIPQTVPQPMERQSYVPIEPNRMPCCQQPQQQLQSQIPFARASYPQAIDYMDSAPTNPYYFQCSFSLPTIGVSNSAPQPTTEAIVPLVTSNIPTQAPIYTPLQPMRLGTHASFDQPTSTCERFDVLVNRRSLSVPQALSCSDILPFSAQAPGLTSTATEPGPSSSQGYPFIKHEPYEFPSEMRRSSCSSLTICPRRSLPTPSTSTVAKEKQFVCNAEGCEKRFARVDELKRHQRTHSDFRPYTCNVCDKGFTRSDHLITHRRTHTGEKPYSCQYCDRCFARSDERSRHLRTHTNPRPSTSTRGRRPSTKYQVRKPLTPQQSQQNPGPSSMQSQTSYQQLDISGASSDTSYSQSESYRMYQPPPPQPPPQ
nr:early growth response protein 3 [Hymenolepis microstoma]